MLRERVHQTSQLPEPHSAEPPIQRASAGRIGHIWSVLWQRTDRPRLSHLVIFYLAYVLAGGLGQGVAIVPEVSITFWPPAGIFLVTLLRSNTNTWTWWVLFGWAAEMTCNAIWFNNAFLPATLYFGANALEAMTGAWLLRRFASSPFQLEELGNVVALVVLAGGVAPTVGASVGCTVDAAIGKHAFSTCWPMWWLGDGSGLLISAPMTFVAISVWNDRAEIATRRYLEVLSIALVILLIGYLEATGRLPTAYVMLPPLLWTAVRFQLPGAVIALGGITLMTAAFTALGVGEFAGTPENLRDKLLMLKTFFGIAAISAMMVAALAAQYRRSQISLVRANDELERRVAERTAALRANEVHLQRSRNRLNRILQSSPAGIIEADKDGRMTLVNERWCTMLGYTEPELLRMSVVDVTDEASRPGTVEAIAHLADGGSDYQIDKIFRRKDGSLLLAESHVSAIRSTDGTLHGFIAIIVDIEERKRAQEREHLLTREVNHRAKNMLSLLLAIARQTMAGDPQTFVQRLSDRIQSLAASHDVLVNSGWLNIPLVVLVRSQLEHFKDAIGTRIRIAGPELKISAAAAQAIGLALHELSTNAAKYGALSDDQGKVEITWDIRQRAGEARFVMEWRESGGPSVVQPERQGFGSTVISNMVKMSVEGQVQLDYHSTGLVWQLICPAENVLEEGRPAFAGAAPMPHSPMKSSTGLRRILVVEDEALIALEVADMLRDAEFEVLGPAGSVKDALVLLDEQSCDAAVLDVNLGSATSEPIAERLLASSTPVITVSGYGINQRPKSFGKAPHLDKPLRSELLIQTLNQCLASREAQGEQS